MILIHTYTFSLTIGGVAQHLISYYRVEDVEQGRLRSPSSLPELASLEISPEYLDKTHFRNPPKVEIGVDGIPRYRGEADDIEPPPAFGMLVPADYLRGLGRQGERFILLLDLDRMLSLHELLNTWGLPSGGVEG